MLHPRPINCPTLTISGSKIVWNKFLSDRSNLEKVSLSMVNLRLHSLRETSQLVHLQYLDLSHNELIKLGATFSPLLSLKYLILDSNSIYIVDDKLKLPSLTILSLANNRELQFDCRLLLIYLLN